MKAADKIFSKVQIILLILKPGIFIKDNQVVMDIRAKNMTLCHNKWSIGRASKKLKMDKIIVNLKGSLFGRP